MYHPVEIYQMEHVTTQMKIVGLPQENEMINENENNENEIEGNREVIQKIFEMMENFTKEITQLKEINNLQ